MPQTVSGHGVHPTICTALLRMLSHDQHPHNCLPAVQATDYRASPTGRGACAADVQRFCKDVEPGGGRTHACLREHMEELRCGCTEGKRAGALNGGGRGP